VREDARKPHHGEAAKRIQQPAARRLHLLAPEANAFDVRISPAQSADEIGSMQIAAGFAGADE
jgi:hypothetical protein